MPPSPVIDLDTRGLRCPLPVLRLETLLRRVDVGTTVRIVADDPIAKLDIPVAAASGGHICRKVEGLYGAECVFEVTRGAIAEKP